MKTCGRPERFLIRDAGFLTFFCSENAFVRKPSISKRFGAVLTSTTRSPFALSQRRPDPPHRPFQRRA